MKAKVDKKKPPSSSSSSETSSDEEIKVTPKVSAKATPKTPSQPTPKATPKATPAAVPAVISANKFPKRAKSSSSSDSDSSSSDEEPAKKKVATTPAAKAPTPATNNLNNNAKVNNKTAPVIAKAPPAQPSPKHVPSSPKIVAPKSTPHFESPKKPVVASKPAPITSSGDESYSRVEPKKTVTNVFSSNCPHCGKDIEVKMKFS